MILDIEQYLGNIGFTGNMTFIILPSQFSYDFSANPHLNYLADDVITSDSGKYSSVGQAIASAWFGLNI
jgi:hypothetical protein